MQQTATDTIELKHHYSHPINSVWDAITDEKSISDWFIKARFEPVVGFEYTFTHESTVISGKVLTVNRPNELAYTWIVGGTDVATTVRWLLEESDDGTDLTLIHSGIEAYGDSAAKMFESFKGGWGQCVSELETFLGNADA